MRRFTNLTIMAAAMALAAGTASATDFSVNLTGNVTHFSESQFEFNGFHYDEFFLNLNGLDSNNAITVAQGDTISATVTLDQALTIPMSPDHTDFLLYLQGSAFPAENSGDSGTFEFYDGGVLVKSFTFGSTTSSQLSTYAALYGANNETFTFDSFVNTFTIDTLATPATLDSSSLSYAIVSPGVAAVPEPSSWAMMILGFGAIGAVSRRGSVRARFAR